jgi:hypothetical protein
MSNAVVWTNSRGMALGETQRIAADTMTPNGAVAMRAGDVGPRRSAHVLRSDCQRICARHR